MAQDTALDLAQKVVKLWSEGTEADFAAVYPFQPAREVVAASIKEKIARKGGLAKVVQENGSSAVLVLSGLTPAFNSGDDTWWTHSFSGIYRAQLSDGRWKLTETIPLGAVAKIQAHHLKVSIRPAFGLTVEDRIQVTSSEKLGFAARLNHAAKIESVRAGTRELPYAFGGGLLWVDVPVGQSEFTLKYSLEVDEGPNNSNSGAFLRKAGHVRGQYFWHPFFDFTRNGDDADFEIELRIPREYQATTSLAQSERLEGAERVIAAKTTRPASELTLVYDRAWEVKTAQVEKVHLDLFVTPQFQPDAKAIEDEFRSVYGLLSQRFGAPESGYFGVVEARSKEGNGWHFAANQIVVAAGWPQVFSIRGNRPHASLGHEIAHLWTDGAGPAANFLREGWATYAETFTLEKEYGAAAVRAFWKYQSDDYFRQFDGKAAIVHDDSNSGIAYPKGSWIFRMLEDALGTPAFQKTITEFSRRSLAHAGGGWELLAECAQHNAPADFDANAFLRPWVEEKSAPRLTAQADGSKVTVRQEAPFFSIPVTIEASTTSGTERKRVWIKGAETAVEFSSAVASPRIDPDGLLLVRK